ncbi:hypothetical protein BDI4_800029 [Burkholderia diffusa]|nr:hypothetical protein BDI4_800005 [Burkholderia diffusa]CAG9264029.1 hypothetical protein BDI4_800029 [Burkholderia diffusa]
MLRCSGAMLLGGYSRGNCQAGSNFDNVMRHCTVSAARMLVPSDDSTRLGRRCTTPCMSR